MILIRRLTNSTSKKDDVSPLHGAYGGVITGEPACVFLSTTRRLMFGSVVFVGKGAGSMEIGIVGLGKMGANIAFNVKDSGHRVVGFDMSEAARAAVEAEDIETVDSMAGLVSALGTPRVVWAMVPSGPITDAVLAELFEMLDEGDTEKLVDYLKVFSRVNAAISCEGVVRKCCHRKARISLHLTARFCFAGQASR